MEVHRMQSLVQMRRPLALLVALVALGSLAFTSVAASNASPDAGSAWSRHETIRFDVAENGLRFFFADAPVFEDGMPAAGNPFVTEGYLYPAGTLDGTNGVLADGSPEFPEKVIGTWFCRGYLINDGMHTTTGPMVISTQIINFGDEYGGVTLVTEGFELADVGVPVSRAITGGTGPYQLARGEVSQVFHGYNTTMGVSLSVEAEISKR
jgi:hypothetical protein